MLPLWRIRYIERNCPKWNLLIEEYVAIEEQIYIPPDGTKVNVDLEEIAHLHVISYMSVAPKNENWYHINIFFTYVKIGNNILKIMINGGSCTNLIDKLVTHYMDLKVDPHPNQYGVTWADETSCVVT